MLKVVSSMSLSHGPETISLERCWLLSLQANTIEKPHASLLRVVRPLALTIPGCSEAVSHVPGREVLRVGDDTQNHPLTSTSRKPFE